MSQSLNACHLFCCCLNFEKKATAVDRKSKFVYWKMHYCIGMFVFAVKFYKFSFVSLSPAANSKCILPTTRQKGCRRHLSMSFSLETFTIDFGLFAAVHDRERSCGRKSRTVAVLLLAFTLAFIPPESLLSV